MEMSERIMPVEVTGLELVFGGDMNKLLPPMEKIPQEFKAGHSRWNDLIGKWFFHGIKKLEVMPREGVDRVKALRHVKACMASWEPKHQHKEAGCAYLMSQFFEDDFTFEVGE